MRNVTTTVPRWRVLILAVAVICMRAAVARAASSASFILTNQAIDSGLGSSASASFLLTTCLGTETEGAGSAASASFRLQAGCPAGLAYSVCGNGISEPTEQCDDGNTVNGDCCSSVCQLVSSGTTCRGAAGECDAPEQCTGTSGACPPDQLRPAGTACSPDADPCTTDACSGTSVACTHVVNPLCLPSFPGGPVAGSSTVTGTSNPQCIGGVVKIFDCGPEVPPICAHCTTEVGCPDQKIGQGTKDSKGNFVITVTPPLKPGQIIYATDGCTDPALVGPDTVVTRPAPAPVLSPHLMLMLVAVLGLVGVLGVRRLRTSR